MLITTAYAQTPGAAGPGGAAGEMFTSFIMPMILIFGVFYFLMFRPQQRQMKEHRARIDAVKKGDTVTTGGGLIGKVTKVEPDEVEVEIATGVKVRVVKSTLSDVQPLGGTKPANDRA